MLRLRDVMTTEVLTVTPGTPLREAMELLAGRHIGGLPVIENGRVVGVVSTSDVLAVATTPSDDMDDAGASGDAGIAADFDDRAEEGGADGEVDQAGRDLAGLWAALGDDGPMARAAGGSDPLATATVADAMTWGVYALPPAAGVAAAAECMRSADVHRLLVMEEGRLLGIVTTMDLARAVARNRVVNTTRVLDR